MREHLVSAAREIAAFAAALLSIVLGLYCAIVALGLALAIQHDLWLIVPCLFIAALVPVFLVALPGLVYRWRFGFPEVWRTSSRRLSHLRKAAPF